MPSPSPKPASEAVIKSLLRHLVHTYTKIRLIDIELVEEYEPKTLAEVESTGEPYRKLSISRLPRNSKLKIRLEFEQPRTGRRITAIASTRTLNGSLRHLNSKIESPELETLRNEVKKRKVKRSSIEKILRYLQTILHSIISGINLLRNAGLIHLMN